jgi:Putative zinc-finger
MTCDEVLQLLPDHAMGTLSETEEAAVRRHLRGCGACRADAQSLDSGVAMFASAAHVAEPPPELRSRVMTALQEEWADADRSVEDGAAESGRSARHTARWNGGRTIRWLAVAAVVLALGAAVSWGAVQHGQLSAARGDQASYQRFLHLLGGKEVRVAKLHPTTGVEVTGTAVLYDSDRHESWGVFEMTAPGYDQPLTVRLVSTTGETLDAPFPVKLGSDGHGSGWLGTAADISSFKTVLILDPAGRVLARGVANEVS